MLITMSNKDSIITLPNPHLREKSSRVKEITPEIEKLIKDMELATLDWEDSRPHEVGVALAAIQLDQPYRVVIIRNNFNDKKDRTFHVLINPEIVRKEGEIIEDFEGCLSVKDVYGKVPRYSKIKIKALDQNGREIRIKAEDFLARVLQHEIDHTDGITFVDHLKGKTESFYKLLDDGKLTKISYEDVEATGIFR